MCAVFFLTWRKQIEEGDMASCCIPIFILLFLIPFCKSDDQLTLGKPLSHGDVLVSNGGDFALGFFSPTSSNRSSYLGIWYNNIPVRTIVWIANRDDPITAPASVALTITNSSDIVLSGSQGGDAFWVVKSNLTTGAAAAAVLLNTGNFVLRLPNGTDIWQSFDHPTDTILPSMRFVVSYKDHVVGRLVAWKGPDDPSSGDFSCSSDPASPGLQIVTWNKTTPYCRVNVWSDLSVSGGTFQNNTNSIIYQTAINQGEEFYFVFTISDGLPFKRITLDPTGKLLVLSWNNRSSSWALINQHPTVPCEVYASCGPFSYCNINGGVPACQCLDGFEPAGEKASQGCRRKETLECGGQSNFLALSAMKVPDKFLHIQNRSFDQCADECSRNCSCTAYAYANMSNGGSMADLSRCLLWTGELVDTGNYGRYGENLYIRIADSPVNQANKSHCLRVIVSIMRLQTFTPAISAALPRAPSSSFPMDDDPSFLVPRRARHNGRCRRRYHSKPWAKPRGASHHTTAHATTSSPSSADCGCRDIRRVLPQPALSAGTSDPRTCREVFPCRHLTPKSNLNSTRGFGSLL